MVSPATTLHSPWGMTIGSQPAKLPSWNPEAQIYGASILRIPIQFALHAYVAIPSDVYSYVFILIINLPIYIYTSS